MSDWTGASRFAQLGSRGGVRECPGVCGYEVCVGAAGTQAKNFSNLQTSKHHTHLGALTRLALDLQLAAVLLDDGA